MKKAFLKSFKINKLPLLPKFQITLLHQSSSKMIDKELMSDKKERFRSHRPRTRIIHLNNKEIKISMKVLDRKIWIKNLNIKVNSLKDLTRMNPKFHPRKLHTWRREKTTKKDKFSQVRKKSMFKSNLRKRREDNFK